MTYSLINLTLPLVINQVQDVLDDYPEHPYQAAFSIHELRQKLIAHVLSQIPNRYTVEGAQSPPTDPKLMYPSSLEQRLHMETLIHGSILHILRENADRIGHYIPQLENSNCKPSH
ncbi:MAG: hypothetical protein H0X31_12235 [Nostocaceae cyanobacterium]|nr:hypothetical protein [Nostocaceae cyanobacterium]